MSLFDKKYLFYILFLGFLGLQISKAQEQGKPFIKNYPSNLYLASIQNWAVVQDPRGVLYFGNDNGVLEYDGKTWNLIQTTNSSAVRSLSIDKDGFIYVGAKDEFGYLAPDSLGRLEFISLKNQLPNPDINFGDVWSTHATNDKVYFQTDPLIIQYDIKSREFVIWETDQGSYFFLSYLVGQNFYAHEFNKGLHIVRNDGLELAPGGEKLKGERVYMMLPYKDNQVLLSIRNQGLFIYNPDSASLEAFDTEAKGYLLKNQIYNGTRLKNGDFAFCTRGGGLVVLNPQGKLVSIVNQKNGLLDNNIRYVFEGYDQILWLALNNGISQVNLYSPIRYWDESLGIQGNIKSIIEFEEVLYVATDLGVFYLREGLFYKVQGIDTECWTLLNFRTQEKDYLLAGSNDGVHVIDNGKASLLEATRPKAVLTLHQSENTPSLLYAGLKGGLLKLEYAPDLKNNWKEGILVAGLGDEIYSIAEDKDENLWLGTFIRGVMKIQSPKSRNAHKVIRFTEKDGLPTQRDIRIYRLRDRLLFATRKGLFYYNQEDNTFLPEPIFGTQFTDGSQGIYQLVADEEENIWVADLTNLEHPIGMARRRKNGSYRWLDTPLRRLPGFNQPVIYPASHGIVWIGGSEGLYRYDSKATKKYDYEFSNLMRKAIYQEDSVLLWGSFYLPADERHPRRISQQQPEALIPTFPYSHDFSISFEYISPFFDEESANEYSYYLEERVQGDWLWLVSNLKKKWSIWTKDTKKQYTNLPEGHYVFYVKSRNVYGIEGKAAKFEFSILPPWYRTVYAYIVFFLLIVLAIYLMIKFYTARLRRQKRILEETVEKRTREISEKNKVLEKQRTEIAQQAEYLQEANNEITQQKLDIEEKNEEITSSINYASRIQGAMLPSITKLRESFSDAFVLFKPRDIVSGDFYWFSETLLEPRYIKNPNVRGTPSIFSGFTEGKKIIAAVDCTGHGVPGAFMSMMGDAYLNQIISEEGITQPELILKSLHDNIRYALNQDETNNLDGMDMSLCVFNPNYLTLEFAGAKNPIIYIQDGELHQISGDKFGIAGFKMDDSETFFTRHIIPIDRPTTFYLFSDGYADQFGGERGRKFMLKRMRNLFLENYHLPLEKQREILIQTHYAWKRDQEQVDDILVIGIHIDPADYHLGSIV